MLAVLFLATAGVCAHPLDVWHWRSPLPQGNPLNAITYGDGLYVAVGDLGTILTSPDGTNWSRRVSATFDRLNDVVHKNNQFVAVGDYGTIVTSSDGVLWTPQYGGTFFHLHGVACGEGLYVAVGEDNTLLTSSDGAIWVSRSSGPFDLRDIAYGAGSFVAVGRSAVLTSSDGLNWFKSPVQGTFQSVAFGNGLFVASGAVYSSADVIWASLNGVEWQVRATGLGDVRDLTYAAGHWVAASVWVYSDGRIYSSTDATTWTLAQTNDAPVLAVTFGADRFIATSGSGTVLQSTDAGVWTNPLPQPVTPLHGWRDITYAEDRFIAVDPHTLAVSANGEVWTNSVTVTNLDEYVGFQSIAYGQGLYVAGGDYRTLWVSHDAVTWTNPIPELNVRPYVAEINDIIFTNGLFVAVGGYRGSILTSSNGTQWSLTDLITDESVAVYLQAIAFGNGLYVTVANNRAAVSTNGWEWDSVPLEWPVYLTGVAFGNGKFVATGADGFWTSTDGTNWVRSATHDGSPGRIAFGGGYFVGLPYQTYADLIETLIWTSPNGEQWTTRHSYTARGLANAAFGNGAFVVVGGNAILQSDPLIALGLHLNSTPTLTLHGPVNCSYSLEYSDGTGAWQPLKTVFADSMPFPVIDASATNHTRIYRARLRP